MISKWFGLILRKFETAEDLMGTQLENLDCWKERIDVCRRGGLESPGFVVPMRGSGWNFSLCRVDQASHGFPFCLMIGYDLCSASGLDRHVIPSGDCLLARRRIESRRDVIVVTRKDYQDFRFWMSQDFGLRIRHREMPC